MKRQKCLCWKRIKIVVMVILLLVPYISMGILGGVNAQEVATEFSINDLPSYPESTQEIWVIFKEGYRNERIEMSICEFSDLDNPNAYIIWDRGLTIQNATMERGCSQYYFDSNGMWEYIGSYGVLSDWATEVIASNLDIYDADGNLILKANDLYKKEVSGFDLKKDGHCIINSKAGFDYPILSYKIPLKRYQEVFGETYTKEIYKQEGKWGGNCLGMSMSAILFYKDSIPLMNYLKNGTRTLTTGGWEKKQFILGTGDIVTLDKKSELTKLIERYQIWQKSQEFINSDYYDIKNNENAFRVVVDNIISIKEPYLVVVFGDKVGHAMVVDSIREPKDLGDGWYEIYLYDPNWPYFEESNDSYSGYQDADKQSMKVNVETGQWEVELAGVTGAESTVIGKEKDDEILFIIDDYPKKFDGTANYRNKDENTTQVAYSSDDFNVFDNQGILLFKKKSGKTVFINEELVTEFRTVGYVEELGDGVCEGYLILPKGQYRVDVEQGKVAFLQDGDYAGIVTTQKAEVTNVNSTSLEIKAVEESDINVVIEDVVSSDVFTSMGTDIIVGNDICEISLTDTLLDIKGVKSETINVDVTTQLGESYIDDFNIKDIESLDVWKSEDKVIEIFDDVPENAWYVESVQYVYDRNIMKGKGDSKLVPGKERFGSLDSITRGEFATLLYNMENKPEACYEGIFPDVAEGVWYSNPIQWIYTSEMAKGNGDGTFRPNAPITREQMAQMLYAYCKMKEYDLTMAEDVLEGFADSEEISKWAVPAMKWATTQGVMNGSKETNPRLNPQGNATRAECAAMIRNMLIKMNGISR